jgi:predicted MFS family arabinose efflux permease
LADELPISTGSLVRARLGGPVAVLILISGSHAVIHAYSTLMPWVYPLALVDLNFSVTALGVMVGISSLAGGLLQLGAGGLTRIVRRHTLIGWGAVLMGISGVAAAAASDFAQFFAANVFRSVVTSTQHPLGNSLLSDLYSRSRRGMAIAGHIAGGNVGTVLLTPAAAFLVVAWGWRRAVLLLTVPAIIAGIAILVSIKESPKPDSGRSPFRDMLAGVSAVRSSRNLVLIFAASLVAAGGRGLGVVILVVPLFLKRQLHLQDPYATVLYSLLLLGSVIGPLMAGRISDRMGRRRPVLLAAYGLSAVSTVGLLAAPASGIWLPLVLAALGLVVYAESPLLQTFMADEAPVAQRDAIFSLYFAVAFGIGAIWAAAVGVALEHLGYTTVLLIMAITYLAAGACVWATRETAEAAA